MEIADRAVKTIFHSFSALEVLSLPTLSLFCSRLADSKSISNLFRNLSPRLLVVPSERGREVIQIDCLTENGSFNPQGELLRLRSARYCVSQFQNSFQRSFRKASRCIQPWEESRRVGDWLRKLCWNFQPAGKLIERLTSLLKSMNSDERGFLTGTTIWKSTLHQN